MERANLELLEKLEQKTSDSKLQRQLRHHHLETRRQIQNLHRAFEALGKEPEALAEPVVEGLEAKTERMLDTVDEELVNSVILDGVIETEHHEIAVYEELIITAETTGEEDLVPLFQENLEEEERSLDEAVRTAEELSYLLSQRRRPHSRVRRS